MTSTSSSRIAGTTAASASMRWPWPCRWLPWLSVWSGWCGFWLKPFAWGMDGLTLCHLHADDPAAGGRRSGQRHHGLTHDGGLATLIGTPWV